MRCLSIEAYLRSREQRRRAELAYEFSEVADAFALTMN